MDEYIYKNKTTHEMWQNLYKLEEKLEKEHGLDIRERHNVQIGFEAGLEAVVNMPVIDIIRCEVCKYWSLEKELTKLNGERYTVGYCCLEDKYSDCDWFCADGERKNGNE